MEVVGERDPRRRNQLPMESIYALSTRKRKFTEGRSMSMEDIPMKSKSGKAESKGETLPKEQREKLYCCNKKGVSPRME